MGWLAFVFASRDAHTSSFTRAIDLSAPSKGSGDVESVYGGCFHTLCTAAHMAREAQHSNAVRYSSGGPAFPRGSTPMASYPGKLSV